ncbi:MAG: glycosyltransferase [Leptospiraceae bacterium]|nr:glycosyltransferase [Leptospiraceae bacterium]MCK6382214.1 glycosyltransferase [Leptospiraceae bacterium]NUM42015.1 glycosyltransferase [Leptospiraceae bacterium]
MRVFQHVDELNPADGIGNDVRGIHNLLTSIGVQSFIVCQKNNSELKKNVLVTTENFDYQKKDLHILHYGGEGYPLNYFLDIKGWKSLRFHNITPSYFFSNLDVYESLQTSELKSIFELSSMKNKIEFTLCDSKCNKIFLETLRFSNLRVVPILKNYDQAASTKESLGFTIGFTGRFAPNKKIEDLFLLLYFLKKINPSYSLKLIGKTISAFSDYNFYLKHLATEFQLEDSIFYSENLSDERMNSEFSKFDFYISMSEHEGFGIPLLEAFSLGIPVIAFDTKLSAVAETMNGGGILFQKKSFALIAEFIELIRTQNDLRDKIITSQNQALKYYNNFPYEKYFREIVKNYEN